MANDLYFKMTGLESIESALDELPLKVTNKVLRAALKRAAKPLAEDIRQGLPEGETGALKAAVKVQAGKKKRGSNVLTQLVTINKGNMAKWYGAFRELGTSRMEGSNVMRETFDAQAENLATQLMEEIQKGIDKVVKGG